MHAAPECTRSAPPVISGFSRDGVRLSRAHPSRKAILAIHIFVLGAGFAYEPWCRQGPIVCQVRRLTGLACPSCGLTRSFCAMSHGRFFEAFAWHPLGPGLFGLVCLSMAVLLLAPRRWDALVADRRLHYGLGAAFLAAWVLRMVR